MKREEINALELADTQELLDEISNRFDRFVLIYDMEGQESPDDGYHTRGFVIS